ncbi:MAG: adenosylcobinamide amidohydrolase [Acidobacteria bacterium]|nr:adenosylcobinamide amidohydrolase [Acidobacteriota bacterium]
MYLGSYYNGMELHRDEKIVYARFLTPHRVISTCMAAGGISDDLTCLYNHQSCEPKGHDRATNRMISSDPRAYRRLICQKYDLPDESCATLGTAANMHYAAIKEARFRDQVAVAVVTGGVETNAGRAGDKATVYEWNGAYERVSAEEFVRHGTINIMLFINQELTEGAMVRSIITATEAKTAALQELIVGSRYSDGLATGTGTDQIGIASRLRSETILTGTGKHSVIGELIGKTVREAVLETLKYQNSLMPENCRSTVYHMQRFGVDRESFIREVSTYLSENDAELFRNCFVVVECDPLVVAAVAAIVHLRDEVAWGILPAGCVPELWAAYGAQIAAAVSGKYDRIAAYRETLAAAERPMNFESFPRIVARAAALGFSEKWD